jgi:hypothetical protein
MAQVEAETQLANNMRNTMSARDADIQSIKDLCSEQQKLGVIGDEVQLAGAQELATYLSKKSSLEKLIPVMNDMVAQQYGFNATQESAATIATMLGKVMDGQVNALSRYGYSFTDAQEQILKFGDEEQRAATLADVITASVGGTNAALAQTDAGKAKQVANAFGDMKENIGRALVPLQGALQKIVELGTAAHGFSVAINGIRGLTVAVRTFTKSLQLSVTTARTLRVALIGLTAATGVGLAFTALSVALEAFCGSAKEAEKAAEDTADAKKDLAEAAKAGAKAESEAKVALDINIGRTKNFTGSKAEEQKIVKELNKTYGETMGYFSSVSAWYNALVKNSAAYCQQLKIEAEQREIANQMATVEEERRDIIYEKDGKTKKKYSTRRAQTIDYTKQEKNTLGPNAYNPTGTPNTRGTYVDIVGSSAVEKARAELKKKNEEYAALLKRSKELEEESRNINMSVKGAAHDPTGRSEKTLIENASSYKDLTNNVAYYQQEIDKCDGADTARITVLANAKKAAEDAAQAIKDMAEAASIPTDPKTIDDYSKKLSILNKQKSRATEENIAGIEEEIAATEKAKKALENKRIAAIKDDEIKDSDTLNQKLSYYNQLLSSGDAAQKIMAQNGINYLNKLSKSWKEVVTEATLPKSLTKMEDFDTAINFYTSRQQGEDADQIMKTQAIIDDLTAQKRVFQLSTELPGMQKEIDEINALTGHDRTIKIKSMGLEEIMSKIKEMNKLLSDAKNPVTPEQRKSIEKIRDSYAQWAKQSTSTFDTLREGYGSVKNIGSGVQGITDALNGNGNAWEKVTGVIDGFLQIYDGIQKVISIINQVTAVTQALTTAKEAENAATVVQTASEVSGASATIGASAGKAAAKESETNANVKAAASGIFASLADIPFAGFAIAAGLVAAMIAVMAKLPKFAKGGIAYGPTLGLFGEYGGASNNPEVVAPLDRLRSLIEPQGGMGGRVEFEIDGRKLRGVLRRVENLSDRS